MRLSDSVVLRDSDDPLTVALCAEKLAALKGIPADRLLRLKTNVAATMTSLSKRKRVRRRHNGDGRIVFWGSLRELTAVTRTSLRPLLAAGAAGYARARLEYATWFKRDDPLVLSLRAAINLTPSQIDDLWAAAQPD